MMGAMNAEPVHKAVIMARGLGTRLRAATDARLSAEQRAVAATGVDGVCVVSALCTAEDPAAAARRLRAAIEGVRV